MKKLPVELKDYIDDIAGPLTKYLGGRLALSFNTKRLIRRDAFPIGWKGNYIDLFGFDTDNFHAAISDISLITSKDFHDWLVTQLANEARTLKIVQILQQRNWKTWWKDAIANWDSKALTIAFESAIEYYHIEMLMYVVTNEDCRRKLLGDYPDCYFIDLFVEVQKQYPIRIDTYHKPSLSKILRFIIRNVTIVGPNKTMDAAALIGDIDIVKWAHENIRDCCSISAMAYAAKNGHLEIIKWLHENRTEGCTSAAMDNAVWSGFFEVVKWLHENRTEGCSYYAFHYAAQYSRFEILEWLLENYSGVNDIHRTFRTASTFKYDHTVKWMKEKYGL